MNSECEKSAIEHRICQSCLLCSGRKIKHTLEDITDGNLRIEAMKNNDRQSRS